MNYLLYNEKADNGAGKESAVNAMQSLGEKGFAIDEQISLLGLDVKGFFARRDSGDNVVLIGGDGTLNHFINALGDQDVKCALFLRGAGNGNDFQRDLPEEVHDMHLDLYQINEFIEKLPFVEVKGKTYRFLNGIGFGIDGECCVQAEEMKAAGEEKIDYGAISVKLLMGPFVPALARVRIDGGEEMTFPKAYLASAMNGRYYGGGMLIAPQQRRGSGKLSLVTIYGKGRLGTLFMFPKLFKGTHVKKKKNCLIRTGKLIEVTFDRPCGLQIDGEVLTGVTTYKAYLK